MHVPAVLSLLALYIPFSVHVRCFHPNIFAGDGERALLEKIIHNCVFIYFLFLLMY